MPSRSVILALLLPFLGAGLTPGLAAQERQGEKKRDVLVTGRVVERGLGGAVSGARVILEETGVTRISDNQGLFEFLRVVPGTYVLRVEHIGYGTLQDTVEVPEGGRLDLDIQLAPRPVVLEPVVVAVEYGGSARIREFYERRRRGMGRYVTRTDIEERHLAYTTDALRQFPGVRLVPRVMGGITLGYAVVMRGGCRPTVYLDGVRLVDRGAAIDDIVNPSDIEGIEVYNGATAPVQYAQQSGGCGAILIWTRGGGGEGRLPWWKGALITGVFLSLATLLTR